MLSFCCVLGCSRKAECDKDDSYHTLPLSSKNLMKIWIHKIGRKKLTLTKLTRVCSRHFVNSKNRKLRCDEYPTLNLPKLSTHVSQPRKRRLPKKREVIPVERMESSTDRDEDSEEDSDASVESIRTSDAISSDSTNGNEGLEYLAIECE